MMSLSLLFLITEHWHTVNTTVAEFSALSRPQNPLVEQDSCQRIHRANLTFPSACHVMQFGL